MGDSAADALGFPPVQQVVVVGGGLAGARMCESLRHQGFDGSLVMVAEELHRPYDRPPLSKDVLLRGINDTSLQFDLGTVDLRLGVRATGLDGKTLLTSDGSIGFDALVVATGAEPRVLPGAGALTLRNIEDALSLRSALGPGRRVVVCGAGWIGAEVTTAALTHGCEVVVVDAVNAPISVAVGEEVGAATLPWWRGFEGGAQMELGQLVTRADAEVVELADGRLLGADIVLVAAGIRPAVRWLRGSDVQVDHAVLVDRQGRSVSRPDVWAVGDAARWWSDRYRAALYVEHWDDALRAPDVAAAAMLGDDGARHDPVPYMWSNQFGRTLQMTGVRLGGERLIWRGDPGSGESWCAAWVDGGNRLRALLAVSRPPDLLQARRRIEYGDVVDPDRIADPAVPIKEA